MSGDVQPSVGESGFVLDDDHFVGLLAKLIGESRHLQNNPPELSPIEDRACRHVLDVLTPLSTEHDGLLVVHHISYVEGRGNVIVEYPGEPGGGVVSFVGAHMDVVPANPDSWTFDPFTLTRDGDKLRGRGTTDCLGHVALLAELFRQLGTTKPKLKRTVVGVFIANEENSKVAGVGVDELVKQGRLDHLKPGPLYWLDVADSQPCIGTGGAVAWTMTAHGKLFHSGIPNKSVNPMELLMEALAAAQARFYVDFPQHPEEARYGYAIPSTMKPTQWTQPSGGVNQIPGQCSVSGDCRLTPFYNPEEAMEKLRLYVADINADISSDKSLLPTRGPASKYKLEDGFTGRVELSFYDSWMAGVACNLDSPGYHAMLSAFTEVYNKPCKPFAMTGSLPCIKDLQDAGYDVQTLGFGLMSTYHANDEYALLSDFQKGFQVLARLMAQP